MELYPHDFTLDSFLQGVTNIIRLRAEEKGIDFAYHSPTPLPTAVHADEKRLRQVLLNLLGNAVKFTSVGNVTLTVTMADRCKNHETAAYGQRPLKMFRFEVADTGPGLTAEQVEKIFQPFEQVGAVEKRSEGTGLGLAISRQLVQAMGGELQAKSVPNQGSSFWFEIPLPVVSEAKGEPRQQVPEREQIVAYEGSPRQIMVVDDQTINRKMLSHMLAQMGFEVVLAKSGQEAIDLAQSSVPDLILMDLVMPEMTGYEATRAMRQIPVLQTVPIVAASASTFQEDIEQAQEAGCDAFLAKPIQAPKLSELLQSILGLIWIYDSPIVEV
jgi:CheY-like chemotaxis protein